jgi:Haem-degrading
MHIHRCVISGSVGLGISLLTCPAFAQDNCLSLPSQGALRSALVAAVATPNGGLGNNMWATLVAYDGTVCAVAFSGNTPTAQWLGSRVISAQKANTANDFSLSNGARLNGMGLALSTANLYSAVQPGGSLYGLQHSNPVDPPIAYQGDFTDFGTSADPMVGSRIGGVNVFGGGLALYSQRGVKIGGLGVSGDTSCTDHFIAWRVRNILQLDHLMSVPGVTGDPNHPDNIIYDITEVPGGGLLDPAGTLSQTASGYGHPQCSPPTPGGVTGPTSLPSVQN